MLLFIYVSLMYNKITTQNVRVKISDNWLFNAFSVFIADLLQKWFVYNGLIQVKGNSKNTYNCKNACHSFMPLHSRIFCDEKDVAPVWLSHDVWHTNFLRFLSWLNYNSALECKLLFSPQNICLELDLVYWQEYLKFSITVYSWFHELIHKKWTVFYELSM